MISFFMVLKPILEKRAMKMATTSTDVIPPVADLYYASPLYLRNLLLWKKSNFLKNDDNWALHETIFFLWF